MAAAYLSNRKLDVKYACFVGTECPGTDMAAFHESCHSWQATVGLRVDRHGENIKAAFQT